MSRRDSSASRARRSSSAARNGRTTGSFVVGAHRPLYRRDSNMSSTSFMDDVEMAQDEVSVVAVGMDKIDSAADVLWSHV